MNVSVRARRRPGQEDHVGSLTPFAAIVLVVLAIVLGVFAVVFLLVPVCKFLWKVVCHVGRFVGGEVLDVLRLVGSLITAGKLKLAARRLKSSRFTFPS